MLTPKLDRETYLKERAICDKARAYADRFIQPSGWTVIPAEAAKHPDYAACNNDMRGRVEQYELLTNPPETLTAYLQLPTGRFETNYPSAQPFDVTTWTGDKIGTACMTSRWRVSSWVGTHMYQFHARIAGREYTGRGFGHGMHINLRETVASKRARATAA